MGSVRLVWTSAQGGFKRLSIAIDELGDKHSSWVY